MVRHAKAPEPQWYSPSLESWNRARQEKPWLKLKEFWGYKYPDRIHFAWAISGNWDPVLSETAYRLFWSAMKHSRMEAAEVLLQFFRAGMQTFKASEWTHEALSHIVMGYERSDEEKQVAKYFVANCWKKRKASVKRERAFLALRDIEFGPADHPNEIAAVTPRNDHREHKRKFVMYIQRQWNQGDQRQAPRKFAEYVCLKRESVQPPLCRCVPQDVAMLMARVFAENPEITRTNLIDHVFAMRHRTSPSTLQKLRAELNRESTNR